MFALWLGNSYLIKVYDDFLPDNFADDIENLHTRYHFGWYLVRYLDFPEGGVGKVYDNGNILEEEWYYSRIHGQENSRLTSVLSCIL